MGTAFVARTSRASLPQIGPLSNPLLLWGILFELVLAAAIVYLPPLQSLFATASLGVPELAILASFPFIVWGSEAPTLVASPSDCRWAAPSVRASIGRLELDRHRP